MKQKIFAGISLQLLLCCLLHAPFIFGEGRTKPPIDVYGKITDTATNEISVDGTYYNISGATIRAASGKSLTIRDLQRGMSVKIHVEGDTVKYIFIYDVIIVQ